MELAIQYWTYTITMETGGEEEKKQQYKRRQSVFVIPDKIVRVSLAAFLINNKIAT